MVLFLSFYLKNLILVYLIFKIKLGICNRFSGECICNLNGKGQFCEECMSGFYGRDCLIRCENNCENCDKINGSCILKQNETMQTTSRIVTVTKLATSTEQSTTEQNKCFSENSDFEYKEKMIYVKFFRIPSKFELACDSDLNFCLNRDVIKIKNNSNYSKVSSKFIGYESELAVLDYFCSNWYKYSSIFINEFTKQVKVDRKSNKLEMLADFKYLYESFDRVVCVYYFVLLKDTDDLLEALYFEYLSYNYWCNFEPQVVNLTLKIVSDKIVIDRSLLDIEFRRLIDTDRLVSSNFFEKIYVHSILTLNISNRLVHIGTSNKIKVTQECNNGYWDIQNECNKRCGKCENESCDSINGECSSKKCLGDVLQAPFCDKCIEGFIGFPNCSKNCEFFTSYNKSACVLKINETVKNLTINDTHLQIIAENLGLLWTGTLVVIITVAFAFKFVSKYPIEDDKDLNISNFRFNDILPYNSLQ